MVFVRDPGTDGVDDGSPDVRGDDEILSLLGRIVEAVLDDQRQKGAETVEDGDDGDLTDSVEPGLGVLEREFDILHAVVTVTTAVRLGELGTDSHDLLFLFVEEVRRLVVGWDQPPTTHGPNQSKETLEDVQPSPTRISSDSVHVQNSIGD